MLKVFPIEDATILEENEHEIQNYVMIALGGVIFIGICAFVGVFIYNRMNKKKDNEENDKLIDNNESIK